MSTRLYVVTREDRGELHICHSLDGGPLSFTKPGSARNVLRQLKQLSPHTKLKITTFIPVEEGRGR